MSKEYPPERVAALHAAFDRVKDKENWKNPINTVIDIADEADRALIEEAVIFFTGSVPDFTPVGRLSDYAAGWHVTAIGYYMAIGS